MNSWARSKMIRWLCGVDWRFLKTVVILPMFLQHNAIAAPEYCGGNSEIDHVPTFINQIFLDVLQRPAVAGDQQLWSHRIEQQNSERCRSADPAVLASPCEWQDAAQVFVELLGTPESISKNGQVSSNSEFVTALYRVLLHRAPDAAGLQSHLMALNSGSSRQVVASTALSSPEYRKRFACRPEMREASTGGGSGAVELGVNGHPLTQPVYSDSTGVSYDDQLSDVRELGAKWYRFDLGARSDLAKMDLLVKKAQEHGVQLLPAIFPDLAANDSPLTVQQKSHDRAFQLVSRYKASVHVWELANELDNASLYHPGDPGWFHAGNPGDQVSDYNPEKYAVVAAMLRGLSEGVHDADSSALRIINYAGWLHTGFFQRVEDDHIPYDIVGIHWYQNMGEITCPGQSLPCPPKPQYFNVIQRLQTITKGKPMWVTETNYRALPSNSVEANRARIDAYLAPTLERYLNSPGTYPFRVVIIYELLDEANVSAPTEGQCGLFAVERRPDGRYAQAAPKQSYQAVQHIFKR